jgi:hypothetical protein
MMTGLISKSEEGGRKMKLKKEMDDEIVRRDRAKRVTESYSRISRVLYHKRLKIQCSQLSILNVRNEQ